MNDVIIQNKLIIVTIFNNFSMEYGSIILPTNIAVKAAPKIIIIQVIVAAAAFLLLSVLVAKNANKDVPEAPTPIPIKV